MTGKEQPALEGVYKLSAIRDPGGPWKYKLKLSEQMVKVSNPGILQVKRFYNKWENLADVVYDTKTDMNGDICMVDPLDPTRQKFLKKGVLSHDLLLPIFREGKRVYELPSLHEIHAKTHRELEHFNVGIKRFLNPHQYAVGMEKSLYDLKVDLIRNIRNKVSHAYIMSDESLS